MPLGKPGPDGEILPSSRHSRQYAGGLGTLTIWDCPACGRKNEGRPPEQGCQHCGSGDPLLGKAGGVVQADPAPVDVSQAVPTRTSGVPRPVASQVRVEPQATRVLRLIEYLIAPGQNADEVLRKSLIGTLHFPWGQLTGTIVDSLDTNQADRLQLAKRQPGVWLGNSSIELGGFDSRRASWALENPTGGLESGVAPRPGTFPLTPSEQAAIQQHFERKPVETPETTEPFFTGDQAMLAKALEEIGGLKLVYTLALALQGIADELDTNSEPGKFLTSKDALGLANALMHRIPDDWTGDRDGHA